MRIPVVEVCGSYCVDPSDGARLFDATAEAIRRGEEVCLDFADVRVLTSSFLTAAIGRLYGLFAATKVDSQLTVRGLDEIDLNLLHEIQANAQRFFASTPEQRAQLIEASSHPIEND